MLKSARLNADLHARYLGSRRTLEPLFLSYSMPPNSDYFPVLDNGAVRARFLRRDVRPLLTLRSASVPLVEMVGAYGTFAAGGVPATPHAVLAVTTADGRTVWRRPAPDDDRRFDADDISSMNTMLRAVVEEGTARQFKLSVPKTGRK